MPARIGDEAICLTRKAGIDPGLFLSCQKLVRSHCILANLMVDGWRYQGACEFCSI